MYKNGYKVYNIYLYIYNISTSKKYYLCGC